MEKKKFSEAIIVGTEWAARLATLNLVFILFSIPLVTVIPSLVALFEVIRSWEKGNKKTPVFKTFLYEFRKNFWRSYQVGLPLLFISVVLIVDIYYTTGQTSGGFLILRYAIYTLTVLFSITALYSLPIFVQYKLPVYKVYFLALTIGLTQPFATLSMLLTVAVVIGVNVFWPALSFFFSISVIAMIAFKMASHSLQKYDTTEPVPSE
ncbi:MAG: DUF624 domain-containing protein [Carnobacterium sp.]